MVSSINNLSNSVPAVYKQAYRDFFCAVFPDNVNEVERIWHKRVACFIRGVVIVLTPPPVNIIGHLFWRVVSERIKNMKMRNALYSNCPERVQKALMADPNRARQILYLSRQDRQKLGDIDFISQVLLMMADPERGQPILTSIFEACLAQRMRLCVIANRFHYRMVVPIWDKWVNEKKIADGPCWMVVENSYNNYPACSSLLFDGQIKEAAEGRIVCELAWWCGLMEGFDHQLLQNVIPHLNSNPLFVKALEQACGDSVSYLTEGCPIFMPRVIERTEREVRDALYSNCLDRVEQAVKENPKIARQVLGADLVKVRKLAHLRSLLVILADMRHRNSTNIVANLFINILERADNREAYQEIEVFCKVLSNFDGLLPRAFREDNSKGKPLLSVAEEKGYSDIVQLFKRYGTGPPATNDSHSLG